MNIKNAKYTYDDEGNREYIKCDIDGTSYFIPMNSSNRHYAEIMRQVEAGTLTIQEAEA